MPNKPATRPKSATQRKPATPRKPARKPSVAAPDVADLAARIAALESALRAPPATAATARAAQPRLNAETYWILDRLAQSPAKGGEVAYAGAVTTPTGEQYLWQRHAEAGKVFAQDWTGLSQVLAALGHPVRLKLLQRLLSGQTTKAELERIEGLGTTGQLYHHLKTLQDAGWVRSLERGTYGVPGERVVPLLAMLVAASG